MASTRDKLTHDLREAGFSKAAIEAAWPSWWVDEAETSASGKAELRFALARKLGLSPKQLVGDRVEYFWDDAARFKHLRTHNAREQSAIASFGIAIGRALIVATPEPELKNWQYLKALDLRKSILSNRSFVDLESLVAACWAFGIPIIHLGVFPLETKSMHAMIVHNRERFAILLAKNAKYPAEIAFTIAHELGHALLGHINGSTALIDLENSVDQHDGDAQENEADEFALTLLTGSSDPIIVPDSSSFNAPTLASAAIRAASDYSVEPGMIALTLAYRDGSWARTMAALKFIYGDTGNISAHINKLAINQINWDLLNDDIAEYLNRVMASVND